MVVFGATYHKVEDGCCDQLPFFSFLTTHNIRIHKNTFFLFSLKGFWIERSKTKSGRFLKKKWSFVASTRQSYHYFYVAPVVHHIPNSVFIIFALFSFLLFDPMSKKKFGLSLPEIYLIRLSN